MPSTLDALLTRLESGKNNFGSRAAAEVERLLDQLARCDIRDPKALLRFHEALLFLRAFPQSASLVPRVEHLLNTFHQSVDRIRQLGTDMSIFDDFDTSGLSGTVMQDALNFEAARWLVRRIPRNVEIAWNDFDDGRAMGTIWPRVIPLLREDSDVEATIPWRQWLVAARGRKSEAEWLIDQFEKLGAGEFDRTRDELYDLLRLPLRWRLENLKLTRTRNWKRPRKLYVHDGPLITRREVSLADELDRPAPRLEKVPRREAEEAIRLVREVMLVRYRELYGTTLADVSSVVRAELDRGVVMFFWNLPPARRLPLRAYVAGFTLKNGVPINYIEAIGLFEWIEVGFNTFYTYRQGETAWIYAQALRCLCAITQARVISVYPYQIGLDNDEALDSGAFWFYRKMGFRSGNAALEQLARKEESKIAADATHHTSRRTLKRLAESHIFYDLDGETNKNWDTFSTRHLGLRVNRRMADQFAGDRARMVTASVDSIQRILHLNTERLSEGERRSLENWSPVLGLIDDLGRWSSAEKKNLVSIIRAQAGANEMRYLYLTQKHLRLRQALLRLGSK